MPSLAMAGSMARNGQIFHELGRISNNHSQYNHLDTDSQVDLESLPEKSHKTISLPLVATDICWFHYPSEPWTISYYFTDGQENFHIYLWLLKDLTWVQSWYIAGILIGGFACFWSVFLVSKSIRQRNINEFWSRFADLLWLFANYWWMIGETHDYTYPDEPSIYEARTRQAAVIMITALIWIGLYYILLKPLGFTGKTIDNSDEKVGENQVASHHEEEEPTPRFSFYFKNWREYENLHSLFWIGKDTAWVLANTPMWFIFFFPTVAVSMDVTLATLHKPKLLVDHAHHCAQFLWVLANAVWASGELFLTTHHDEPLSLARFDSEARVTSRWWSSWVVLFSFLPLVILHLIWIPATLQGKLNPITAASLRENSAKYPQNSEEVAGKDTVPSLASHNDDSSPETGRSDQEGKKDGLSFSPLFLDRDLSTHSSTHI